MWVEGFSVARAEEVPCESSRLGGETFRLSRSTGPPWLRGSVLCLAVLAGLCRRSGRGFRVRLISAFFVTLRLRTGRSTDSVTVGRLYSATVIDLYGMV